MSLNEEITLEKNIKDNIDMSNLSILENNDTQISSINNEIVNLITNINMRSK